MSSQPPGYVVAAGTGEVYSYVVHHHPPVPGKKLPIVIALVQLTEGVRMTGELLGAAPGELRIGLPVRAEFMKIDDELTLPAWRALSPPGDDPPVTPRQSGEAVLPPFVIDVTPTFVISAALATRDFQDVHHDRDRAVAGGAKDIFLNILTTTGLVQRYVADWAGPDAVVRSISVRLGVPCHAGDTLTLTGEVSLDGGGGGDQAVSVVGRCSLGDHVTATVRLAPAGGH
jgi:acyl dehydratase